MRGMNQPDLNTQTKSPLPVKKVHPHTNNYLKMMRQREIDAVVEVTRNQLMDHYDG